MGGMELETGSMNESFRMFCKEILRNKVVNGYDARSREGFLFFLIFLFCFVLFLCYFVSQPAAQVSLVIFDM